MRQSWQNCRLVRRRGVSLLDLTITLFILGIIAAAGAPRFVGSLQLARATAAAERVALDLKYAKRHAKIRHAQETVSFDVAGHRYALSTVADLDRKAQAYTVDLSDYPYESALVSVDFAGVPSVTFNALGSPDHAGQVIVKCGGHQKIVTVVADSGEVIVQ